MQLASKPIVENDRDVQANYEFAVDFFSGREDQFAAILNRCELKPSDPLRILEIGSFEGRSACWFSDNFMDHPQSRLVCIDTFKGGAEHQKFLKTEHPDILLKFLERVDLLANFRKNVNRSRNAHKIEVLVGESAARLPELRHQQFDLIYIDGSHHSEDVMLDGVNAWHLLRDGGALIFDDYQIVCFADRVDVDSFPVQRAADALQVFFCMDVIHDGSMRALRKVAGKYPINDIPMGLARRANALHAEQRDDEALVCLDNALRIEPGFTGALFQKGIIAMSHGDYATGWPLFELRHLRNDAALSGVRYQDRPKWNGEPTSRRLMLWAEEGLGDTIQMLRFVRSHRLKCPNLVLEVQQPLLKLCRQNFDCEVVPFGTDQAFDVQCSLLSPPDFVATIPNAPYLRAPSCERTAQRIGLCWHGNISHTRDSVRSIPLPALAALADEFEFLSLQQEDLKADDIMATAAVIAQLDLVITVDTMIAHLAGALGKEVWVLLSMDCDWRWMQKREDSPWYPSARLFRQDKAGDWSTVLDRIAEALRSRT